MSMNPQTSFHAHNSIVPPPRLVRGDDIRRELHEGLSASEAVISPKFLYNTLGSVLFEAICMLPEYYPTRAEAEVFALHGGEIAKAIGTCSTLIDLGAGNCAKAEKLFPWLNLRHYVPIDISGDYLEQTLESLRRRYPSIRMTGLAQDFSRILELPQGLPRAQRLFFYPGSSIGNFSPDEACELLHRIRLLCGHDGQLLLGVDLVKDTATLTAAYDDDLGVTAAFNLNILRNVNALAETDFDLRHWRHLAFFNENDKRVEMHLESTQEQIVRWPRGHRLFKAGERIHTENSYKYTAGSIDKLLTRAGFSTRHIWTDSRKWFAVVLAGAANNG